MKTICYNRNDFWGCAIYHSEGGIPTNAAFMFVTCMQSPLTVDWLTLQVQTFEPPDSDDDRAPMKPMEQYWHKFRFCEYEFVLDCQCAVPADLTLWILDDLHLREEVFVTSRHPVRFNCHISFSRTAFECYRCASTTQRTNCRKRVRAIAR